MEHPMPRPLGHLLVHNSPAHDTSPPPHPPPTRSLAERSVDGRTPGEAQRRSKPQARGSHRRPLTVDATHVMQPEALH